jgi:glyoxylase-like metal-dependent hydrolase (beta-lactamase superfamily II)
MQEIAPGIFVESRYPPYNVGLILTDNGAIAVDIPPRPSHAWAWQEQVEQIAGRLRYAVITDATLKRQVAASLWNVPIIAAMPTLRAIAAYDEREWRDMLQIFIAQHPEEAEELGRIRPHPPTFAFDARFFLHYRTPPVELEVVAGAAPGSLWITLPDHGLLFAGDTIAVDEPPPLDDTPDSKGWLNTLGALARRATIRTIVPGRGKAPIQHGDIEPQREFLRVMRRTARTLVNSNSVRLTQCAQDLGQAFYNAKGQKAVKRIKAGLEHLVAEIQPGQMEDGESEM